MPQLPYLPMVVNGSPYHTERRLPVLNPATEQVIAEVPDATQADLDAVVAAAREAFPGWAGKPFAQRQQAILAIADAVEAEADQLSHWLVAEQGRPLAAARSEILDAATMCRLAATMELPTTVLEDSDERRIEVSHVPLGVVAAISPWNFPVFLPLWKVVYGMLAGNTVVLKPSPYTPLTMLRICSIAQASLPLGVFNIVTGGDELGPWVTAHPDIDRISFTGSTATGRKVMAGAAASLKRVTLELGGNDAAVVLDDVDLDKAVPAIFWAAFANCGQICMAAKRVYIQDAIYDRFRDAIAAYAREVRIGNGMEANVQLGPIQNRPQFERVTALIEGARSEGLKFVVGDVPLPMREAGYFVPVTIFDNPPDSSRVVTEEAFGPVLPLLRFSSDDEVIARVNDTPYGLAGSVWTRNLQRGRTLAEKFQAGVVWVNEALYLTPFMPFCGHKDSGVGVEGGLEGLLEYTNPRCLVIRK